MIRRVQPDDSAAIAAIYNHYVTDTTVSFETAPVSETEMCRRIEEISAFFPYFVNEEEGRITGYCYAHLWKERRAYRHTLETTIYLRPGCTGRRIGRQLMARLIDSCRQHQVHSLIACVTSENIGSINFHKSIGFAEVSRFRQVGRKFDRWLDVTDLELIL